MKTRIPRSIPDKFHDKIRELMELEYERGKEDGHAFLIRERLCSLTLNGKEEPHGS